MKRIEPGVGRLLQLRKRAELGRLRGAGFRAGRLEATLQAVVGERALVRRTCLLVDADDAVRARRDTVPATVADVLLDEDGVELGADDGVGGAHLHAARVLAVLADVRHHQKGGSVARAGPALPYAFVQLYVTPILRL